jgi:hypothetical protein
MKNLLVIAFLLGTGLLFGQTAPDSLNPIVVSQIRFRTTVGVSVPIDPRDTVTRIISITTPKDDYVYKLVELIKYHVGSSRLRTSTFETTGVPVAKVGVHGSNNDIVILVNPTKINKNSEDLFSKAILAHELGHVSLAHLLSSKITKEYELDADYWSGFASRRCQFTEKPNLVAEAFRLFREDETHGNFDQRREQVLEGWNDAGPSKFAGAIDEEAIAKAHFRLNINAGLRSDADISASRPDLEWRVVLSIQPVDSSIYNLSETALGIKKVRYDLDESMRAQYLQWLGITLPTYKIIRYSKDNPLFQHFLLVWGGFPVTATIYFNNGSQVTLPSKEIDIPKAKKEE